MHINIQARNLTMSNAISTHIKRRLNFALNSRENHIQLINVRLSDINDPRGGEDKCCHIQVVIPKLSDVVIVDTQVDLSVAIDRAVDRTSRAVNKRLAKQQNIKRTLIKNRYSTQGIFPN